MAILSTIASTVNDVRLVPPTEEETSSQKEINHEIKQQQQRRPLLEITSYNRFTPPSPKPDLQYDCRMTQNPSQHARKTCTGLDPSLQDELMRRASFSDMYSRAEDEIRRLMEVNDVRAARKGEIAVVRVGCLCGSGHHRSVAFAEKLREVKWPKEWDVRVEHRDLTEGVQELKRERSEKSRKDAEEREMAQDEVA
jgi:RNase adaptor protein for sRNA GlmZ degradation